MATSTTKRATGSVNDKSHRSYQTVLPCGNKLLQQKWDKTYYDEHRRLVRAAKPMIDTKAPARRLHVKSKLKKQQLEKERAEEIDRDNITLLNKMQRIMSTEGSVDHKNTHNTHHSLNQLQRQREQERVSKENMKMLERIEKVEPMYKVSNWIDGWRRKEELTDMITAYPITDPPPSASRAISPSKTAEISTEPQVTVEVEKGDKEPDTNTTNPETEQ